MGATFALTESVVANTREKDDAWNGASGACAAGFLAGLRCELGTISACNSTYTSWQHGHYPQVSLAVQFSEGAWPCSITRELSLVPAPKIERKSASASSSNHLNLWSRRPKNRQLSRCSNAIPSPASLYTEAMHHLPQMIYPSLVGRLPSRRRSILFYNYHKCP